MRTGGPKIGGGISPSAESISTHPAGITTAGARVSNGSVTPAPPDEHQVGEGTQVIQARRGAYVDPPDVLEGGPLEQGDYASSATAAVRAEGPLQH